jgi:membrane associated rhomboid family serine protease
MGMWFDARELSRAAGLKFDDSVTGAALSAGRRTQHRCPCCAVYLYEREVEKGSGIFIDQCPHCAGLFTDHEEFSRIKAYYSALGAPALAPAPSPEGGPEPAPVSDVDADSFWVKLFQYLTGLPVELGVPQTLFPPVVTALIAANVVMLVLGYIYGLDDWIHLLGVVPLDAIWGRRLYTVLTAMFVHAGVFHLIGNMYFLYVTGDNLEELFGHWKFLAFYLLCGLVACAADAVGRMGSHMPAVGASGAVSGLMGAYMVLFPHVRFQMRWFYYFWKQVSWELPAWAYFGFWVALQVLYASLGLPGVAWWAHIGGFACGALVGVCVRLREPRREATATAQRTRRR